jgi:uncharacterized membrane protein YdbT with pleckstrin-like domain
MVVRPSIKLLTVKYVLAILIAGGGALAYNWYVPGQPSWPSALLALLLFWPLKHHVRRQLTKITLEGGKLRYQSGLMSKSTRIMELHKVQDVRVDQTIGQRIIGTGDLSIETAGETSRLTIAGIDRPNEVAEHILAAARGSQGSGATA